MMGMSWVQADCYRMGDPPHTTMNGCSGEFPDLMCKSGVCGHENCCADSSCSSRLCSSDGSCLEESLPGGECSTTADCYGGKACLGGRCCAFTQSQYEQAPYNADSSQNAHAGCTACGGKDMYAYVGADIHKLPDGTCLTCDSTTTRLEGSQDSQGVVSGIPIASEYSYGMEGSCLSACDADRYMTVSLMADMEIQAGCFRMGDPPHTTMNGCSGEFPDLMCKSGVCGHENCCADSSCSSRLCSSDGSCLEESLPGGECSTTNDCYGGKACLGGRCCAFTQSQYEQAPYNADSSQNAHAGCTACGGKDMYAYVGADIHKLLDGTCLTCDSTTTRLEGSQDSQGVVSGIPIASEYSYGMKDRA